MSHFAIECRTACERLAIACYSLMDHGRYEECAALFASDGTWVRGGKPFTGREAILAALGQRPPAMVSRHVVSNVMIDAESEDTARGTAIFIPLRGTRSGDEAMPLQLASVGDLHFRFRRKDGEWQISELRPAHLFGG